MIIRDLGNVFKFNEIPAPKVALNLNASFSLIKLLLIRILGYCKIYIFGLHPGVPHRLPKLLEFLNGGCMSSVSGYSSKVPFILARVYAEEQTWWPLGSFRAVAVGGSNNLIPRLNLSAQTPLSLGRSEGFVKIELNHHRW